MGRGYLVVFCVLLLAGIGCGSDGGDSSGRGGSQSGGDGDTGNGLGGDGDGSFNAGNGGGTGDNGFNDLMDLTGDGVEVTGSFIWIANTQEGTVSKINTETMMEEGRYLTSPNGSGLPSRTSVSGSGAMAVANRGRAANDLGTESGVTKIYSGDVACPDTNMNGMVDTSTGKADVKPWGQDECVAWHVPLDWVSNRAIAWAPSPAPDAPEVLWTAGVPAPGNCQDAACDFTVLQLEGGNGAVTHTVQITGLSGVNMLNSGGNFAGLAIGNYGPYGGAADQGGNFWVFNGQTTDLIYVDAADPQTWRAWPIDQGNGYGITIDPQGNVHVCGHFGVSKFSPGSQTWQTNMGPVPLGYNGCMTDGGDFIWVGGGVDEGQAGLHQFRADDLSYVASFDVGGGVKGVSVDVNGMIWGTGGLGALGAGGAAGGGTNAYRLDPTSGAVEIYGGLNNPYSYSDMTGFGLKGAGYVPVVLE